MSDWTLPHICPLWYTTALSRQVKLHQRVHKFATKLPKWAKKANIVRFLC